jgi:sodium pump decarboxylase gamma subunit
MQILRAIIAPEYIKGAYPPMQVSSAFVVIMGMGVTFVGLTCIIFLTMLMGKILSKPEAPKPAAAAAAAQGDPVNMTAGQNEADGNDSQYCVSANTHGYSSFLRE